MIKEYEALFEVLAKDNWEQELTNRAILIRWSQDRKYFLVKYNQLASDFFDPVVRACRGTIFSATSKPFQCVCAPFLKFGNYGEGYCPEINWKTSRVLEKIDGSLMKIWYHDSKWHLSTNGTVDAYEAEVDDYLSFGELFEKALSDMFAESFDEFTSRLDKDFTYLFELTAPENRVTIPYAERKIWFLSRRNIKTLKEDYVNDTGVDRPQSFSLCRLEDCLKVVFGMGKDQEGLVVNDGCFNRIKIKSPEYLIASRLTNNNCITTKRIIRMIKDATIDDFLAYCSSFTSRVNFVQAVLMEEAQKYRKAWDEVSQYVNLNRKEFAAHVSKYKEKAFLFQKYSYPDLTAEEFVLRLSNRVLRDLIDAKIKAEVK